jgi:hypothetical protein
MSVLPSPAASATDVGNAEDGTGSNAGPRGALGSPDATPVQAPVGRSRAAGIRVPVRRASSTGQPGILTRTMQHPGPGARLAQPRGVDHGSARRPIRREQASSARRGRGPAHRGMVLDRGVHDLRPLGRPGEALGPARHGGRRCRRRRVRGLRRERFRCPLTDVARRLGAGHVAVTDIQLPRWFARYLPAIHVPLVEASVWLHARNVRRRRSRADGARLRCHRSVPRSPVLRGRYDAISSR